MNGLLEEGGTAELTVEADNWISHNTLPIGTEGETVDLLKGIFDELDYYAIVGI